MKQLLIISGKGGTGKTTVAAAFIKLAKAKVFADCDVDAPNLHLAIEQKGDVKISDYYGLPVSEIDTDLCIECDECRENCRFHAISIIDDCYKVNSYACEGCGVCKLVCPVDAIALNPSIAGTMMLYQDKDSVFSTAQLKMGRGTSGKLVAEVKKNMSVAGEGMSEFAIIDGSPGIGCPVIASLSGVDTALVITEPSISGFSDMERIIEVARKFGVKIAVCVNKSDINPKKTSKIEQFCKNKDLTFVGEIPFDPEAVKAVNSGKTIVDVECISGKAVRNVFDKTMALFNN